MVIGTPYFIILLLKLINKITQYIYFSGNLYTDKPYKIDVNLVNCLERYPEKSNIYV